MVQKVASGDEGVLIVFLIHVASGEDVARALQKLDKCEFILAPTVHYKIL